MEQRGLLRRFNGPSSPYLPGDYALLILANVVAFLLLAAAVHTFLRYSEPDPQQQVVMNVWRKLRLHTGIRATGATLLQVGLSHIAVTVG